MTLRLLVPSSGCASRAPTGPCSLYFVAAPSSTFYQVLPQPHSPAATDTPSPAQVSLPSLSLQGASAPGCLPETLAPSHLPHELSAPYPWAQALPASRPSPHEGLGLLSPVPPVSLTLSHLPILRLGPSQALSCLTSRLSSCQAALSLWPFPEWPGSLSPAADTAPALLTPWLHILLREESAAGSWLLLALHPRFPPAPHPASRPQSTLIHPGNTSGLYLPRPWGPFPCITFPWPCRSLYTFFPWKAHLHPPQHLRPLSLLLPGFFLLSHLCWRPSPTRLSAPVGGP